MNEIRRFLPPGFLLVIGFGTLFFALGTQQDGLFQLASLAIIVVGILVLLNNLNMLKGPVRLVVTLVLGAVALSLAYGNYMVIKGPLDFMAERDVRYEHVVQRLKDIRQVQLQYKRATGYYCNNLDSLVDFVKNDSVIEIKAVGEVPDTLNEFEALSLGIIRRDTTLVPAYQVIFDEKYMTDRDPKFEMNYDSLAVVPFTGGKYFTLNAGEIDRGSAMVPVFEVIDSKPYDPKKVMKVGSMTDPSTSGNWE